MVIFEDAQPELHDEPNKNTTTNGYTFGVMVKMSSVRVAESRRSKSDMGIDIVVDDPRFIDVNAVS